MYLLYLFIFDSFSGRSQWDVMVWGHSITEKSATRGQSHPDSEPWRREMAASWWRRLQGALLTEEVATLTDAALWHPPDHSHIIIVECPSLPSPKHYSSWNFHIRRSKVPHRRGRQGQGLMQAFNTSNWAKVLVSATRLKTTFSTVCLNFDSEPK